MTTPIYERLSTVYDLDWGTWSPKYSDIICRMLRERGIPRARLLDLACGTGSLALELGKQGHAVLGIDISPKMIEVARAKTAALPNVTFQVGDMVQVTGKNEYDGATCTFDSLNYLLDIEQLRRVFAGTQRALKPGGFFLFDCNTHRLYLARHQGTHQRELGGQSFVQELHYDPEEKMATTTFVFSDGTEEIHRQRPYDLDEVRPLLDDADFDVLRTLSGFKERPYTGESERLLCVARKRG